MERTKLNINTILAITGMSEIDLSEYLFSDLKNPILSLRALRKGQREVTLTELYSVMQLTGLSVEELVSLNDENDLRITGSLRVEQGSKLIVYNFYSASNGVPMVRERINDNVREITFNQFKTELQ